jgi:hypothetical protein
MTLFSRKADVQLFIHVVRYAKEVMKFKCEIRRVFQFQIGQGVIIYRVFRCCLLFIVLMWHGDSDTASHSASNKSWNLRKPASGDAACMSTSNSRETDPDACPTNRSPSTSASNCLNNQNQPYEISKEWTRLGALAWTVEQLRAQCKPEEHAGTKPERGRIRT